MLSFQPGRGQNWTITSSVLALISSFCCVKYLMPRKNLVVFSLIPGNLTDAISARQPRSLGQRRTKDIWDYFSPTLLRDKFSYFSNCSSFQGTGISWNVLVIDCEVGDQSNLMHLSLKTVCRLRLSDCMMCNYTQGFQHCDTHRPMPPLRRCLCPPRHLRLGMTLQRRLFSLHLSAVCSHSTVSLTPCPHCCWSYRSAYQRTNDPSNRCWPVAGSAAAKEKRRESIKRLM